MKKKKVRILPIITLVVSVFLMIGYIGIALDWSSTDNLMKSIAYQLNKSSIIDHRHSIFCVALKPGMDKTAVLEVLQQFGEFRYNEISWGQSFDDGYSQLVGNYTDEQIAGRNAMVLSFRDGKYQRAAIIVSLDKTKSVCE